MGAVEISGTWRTTASPKDVWNVVVDLETWPSWWPAIRAAETLEGPSGAPDKARLTFDTPAPLRPIVVGLTVTERDAPERLVVDATDGPLTGQATFAIAPEDEGSRADFDLRLRVRSRLFRPIESILNRANSPAGRERLGRAGDDLAELAGGEPREHELGD
jgi:hypothetical protein